MPVGVILVYFSLTLLLLSQFGKRLSAKSSLVWWLIIGFLAGAVLAPDSLNPVAQVIGVHLVSNLVLGGICLFLIFCALEQSAAFTSQSRKLREVVCSMAARAYIDKAKELPRETHGAKRVLIVIPTYNEQDSVEFISQNLNKLPNGNGLIFKYCFVDDGSSDLTANKLRVVASESSTQHIVNMGVSAALLTGFKVAQLEGFEFVVQCDADGQHPVEEIPAFVRRAQQFQTDLLIGSRFKQECGSMRLVDDSTTLLRRLGSLLVIAALRMFGKSSVVTDPTSGFRVYSRSAFEFLLRNMPDEYPEPETIALLALAGARIQEVPVKMAPRSSGRSSLAGIRSLQFMIKVFSALIGLRLRSFLISRKSPQKFDGSQTWENKDKQFEVNC